eukprot:TRINITY_DN8281_c0_g2_i1.p1 TRINITY_DN8281_c0_g2~~TRINITY_DN8281_c0_g2_i1.p1  ORF type:complete len:217 (+),score=90.19 TRINITY_DN8281_c0_g2_i1:227-877(+)
MAGASLRVAVLLVALAASASGIGEKLAKDVANKILQRDDNRKVEMGQGKKHAQKKPAKNKVPGDRCSRQCIAHSCEAGLTLRWGKYCGIGHSGCPDEEPCDAYDSCCKGHDDCVGDKGVMDTGCHTELKQCLKTAIDADEPTWSNQCSAETIVQTMSSGMDIANLFSNSLSNQGGGAKKPFQPMKKNPKLTNKQYFGRRQEGKMAQKKYRKLGDEL